MAEYKLLDNKEKSITNNELKKELFNFAKEHFQGKKFKNNETGRSILVSRDGLDEWQSKSKSREQILSIKVLDKIIENSRLIATKPDKKSRLNVDGFSYFSHDIKIEPSSGNGIIQKDEFNAPILHGSVSDKSDGLLSSEKTDLSIDRSASVKPK